MMMDQRLGIVEKKPLNFLIDKEQLKDFYHDAESLAHRLEAAHVGHSSDTHAVSAANAAREALATYGPSARTALFRSRDSAASASIDLSAETAGASAPVVVHEADDELRWMSVALFRAYFSPSMLLSSTLSSAVSGATTLAIVA